MSLHHFISEFLRAGTRSRALREAFAERGAELVSLYRHGPYTIEALYKTALTHYWTVKASVDRERVPAWTQSDLDQALHDALVRQLEEHLHGAEEIDAHGGYGDP